jgi:DNA replication and repair protein RecF
LFIESLTLSGVRNLSATRLAFHAKGNLFHGLNGSGKTSLLEGIYLLAVGRSFRSHVAKPVITHNEDHCLVQASVLRGALRQSIGIQRQKAGGIALRINGETAQSHAQLAAALPVVLLDTESLDLVYGAPESRRRYVDATLFHVEQGFLGVWQRYMRALKQRNAGLRRGIIDADPAWLDELARAGELLALARVGMVEQLSARFALVARALSPSLTAVELTSRNGWDASMSLREALDRSSQSDRDRGFTQVGPHRYDVRIRLDGRAAADNLSRGQSKLVLTALKLAQGSLLAELTAVPPVYLVDDIVAELDAPHAKKVCELLAQQDGQVFMTAVEEQSLRRFWPGDEFKMFHVEQGLIQAVAV